jgi:DNA-directed RNA polymerase subunit RPC12/RpoP
MVKTSLRHVPPDDSTLRCSSCSRPLCLGTPAHGQMMASCMHCGERVIFVQKDGTWRVHSRSKAPLP